LRKWFEGLPKSLFHRLIWVVLAGIGAALLSYFRSHVAQTTTTALYILVAVSCVLLIQFALTGKALLSRLRPETTPENVEANIRVWLDNFRMTFRKEATPNAHFELTVYFQPGRNIGIRRFKDSDRYINLGVSIGVGPQDVAKLQRMNGPQIKRFNSQLTFELLRSKANNFRIVGPPATFLSEVHLEQRLPITPLLNEDAFMSALNAMDNLAMLTLFTIETLIELETNPAKESTDR
jgi:hypothetical protein